MSPKLPDTTDSKSHTILLADDNSENLHVLSRILENHGYKVRTAKNGKLALNSMLAAPPDLALLDIHMPEMDGYELCKQMKATPEIAHIPVLFVSAMGETFNKVIAFELGAVDYLSKPVDEKEVIARVKAHLQILDLQRILQSQNAELESVVAERTQELQQAKDDLEVMNERLESVNAAKNEFLKLISHELRTPLVGLGIMDEVFHTKELSDEEKKCYQDIFWSSHQKLINIVDHATTLTQLQMDVPVYNMQSYKLKKLVDRASENLRPLMQMHDVRLNVQNDDLQVISCDSDYMMIVLNAMLETAFKFCNGGQSVEVKWSDFPDSVHMEIKSFGYTVPQKHMDHFFEVFAIQEPIFPGGDLGLAPPVAKQILSVCGGTVSVENRDDEGITLHIRFPKKKDI